MPKLQQEPCQQSPIWHQYCYFFSHRPFIRRNRGIQILHKIRCLAIFAILLSSSTTIAREIDATALYQQYCSVCHGDQGDGRSHASHGMVPPPRDFTSRQSALELNRERIVHAVEQGIPGTAMSGWKSRLSTQQIEALAEFVQRRFLHPVTTADASRGAQIYADYCSVCHGDRGQGAVWATAGLSPPPVNFTDAKIQAGLSRDHMVDAVSHGRAETAMTGWKGRLSEAEIGAVVDYVITNFMPESEMAVALANPGHKHVSDAHAGHNHTHFDINLPFPDQLRGDATRGATLYKANCAACHGGEGDGRGPRAYFINPKPRNFLHTSSRASLNRPKLFEAISNGRLRTEMPAWEKVLTPQQIADIGEYVFASFIKP